MKLTIFEASNLVNAIENAAAPRDTIMPNGLPLHACSREYAYAVADALENVMDEFADQLAANDGMERLQ